MDFVDEQNDVRVGLDFFDHLLQAAFKLAAVHGAGDEQAHVQAEHPLAPERIGHIALDNFFGQSLDNGRFADARIADQDWIILGPARQDVDQAFDF